MRRAAVLLLLAVVAFGGCDDTNAPTCPGVASGRIQGHVGAAGLPLDARIGATRLADDESTDLRLTADVDLAGNFHLEVPAGDYQVSVELGYSDALYDYTGDLPGYGNVPPRTIRVDQSTSPVTVDFHLGGLIVDATMSDDLDGESCAVRLHLRDEEPTQRWETYLDQGSAFIAGGHAMVYLAGVLPGAYRVEVTLGSSSYGELLWLPPTRDGDAAAWFDVAADQYVTLPCSLTSQPARLEGRVGGAWQDMSTVERPYLTIVTADSLPVYGPHRLGLDGSFAVDLHLPGAVKLLVTQNSVATWIGGYTFADATEYDAVLGQTTAGIDAMLGGVHLQLGGDLVGYESFSIEFHDPTSLALLASCDVSAGITHEVGISNLWPGDVLMWIGHSRWTVFPVVWRPQWFDRSADAAGAQPVTIPATGAIVDLDVVLERGGVISGTVTAASGAEGYYDVFAASAEDRVPSVWGFVSLHPTDTYTLTGLPDGGMKVGIWPPGESWSLGLPAPAGTIWYPGTTDWEAATTLQIEDASEITGIDFQVR